MNKLQEKLIKKNGITLVALVITIIILLILAGITISQLTENGLFENSKLAKEKHENAQLKETEAIGDLSNIIEMESSRETTIVSKFFIDTSRKIATIAHSSDWENVSYDYTATEDCAILGQIGTKDKGEVAIYINSVKVGLVNNFNSSDVYTSINYYIKKGDKIEFKAESSYDSAKVAVLIDAFGLK